MAMNYLVILLSWYIVLLNGVNGQDIIIEEVPRSLLISTGHVGTFSCKSCCTHCHGYWVINDTPALKNHGGQAHLESMGFTFFEGYFNESNQRCHVMVVTINASESVNASSIQCDYCPTADQPDHYCQHYEATLLVIASSPITPNPSVTQTNTTHLTLLWSPPFLWPGKRINHYNAFFTTKRECILNEYRVNSNYSDQIVSLTINRNEIPMCTEFKVFVSAVGIDASVLQTFNVTRQIMPSNITEIGSLKIINISIYLAAADGEPAVIEVYIKVPPCHSLPLSYTLSIDSVVIESGQFQQRHNCFNVTVVNDFIKADLQVNRSYLMNVTTNIYSQNVQASDQQIFNTFLPKHKPCNTTDKVLPQTGESRIFFSYQITVVIFCLFIAILLFLAPACVIARIYWNRRIKKKKCINRVHKGMIDNPIYVGGSGPVYDSIVTQPERIQSTGSDQKDTCITNPHYESLHVSNSNTKADTDRYIGRPIQHSINSCHASSMAYQNEMQRVRCNSTSASATTMTGLKSNGQPRNKLGLTLFLGGRDSTMGDNTPEGIMQGVPKVSFVELGNGEEPYAIMNPASSLVQRGQEKELQQIKGNRK